MIKFREFINEEIDFDDVDFDERFIPEDVINKITKYVSVLKDRILKRLNSGFILSSDVTADYVDTEMVVTIMNERQLGRFIRDMCDEDSNVSNTYLLSRSVILEYVIDGTSYYIPFNYALSVGDDIYDDDFRIKYQLWPNISVISRRNFI